MSKGQLSSFWCSKACLCVPVPFRILSNTEERSSSISGKELVWGEGQSDRGWESGMTTLTPHSCIVKVSALGGRESAKQGMQGSRRGQAGNIDNVFPTPAGPFLSPSLYPLKYEQSLTGLSERQGLRAPTHCQPPLWPQLFFSGFSPESTGLHVSSVHYHSDKSH